MALLNTNIGPERVQVFDVPIGTVQIPGVATSVTAFLIGTTHVGAPVNSPTKITDLASFEDQFGDPSEVLYEAYYAVQGFFDNAGTGNTAIIVNVGSAPTAADFIGNAAAGTGLRALDQEDILGLVCVPGLPLSLAYLVHPALIDYTETVRAEFGATLSTSFSLLSVPEQISLADDDELVHTTLFVSSAGAGPYVVTVEDVIASAAADLSAVTAGMRLENLSGSVSLQITAVNDGANTITVATNPVPAFGAGDSLYIRIPSAINYKDVVVNNPSRVAAWYFNPVFVLDQENPGSVIAVDPVGHVAGVMARIDANISIGGPSHAPAGITFAGIAGITGLALTLSERLDAEPLRLNFINRITSFPGSGNIIFGGYTAGGSLVTADEQLIQVMRSLQYIKGSLERGLRGFLWENFSPATQEQVTRAIESFLRNNIHLFPAGLPEAEQFRVVQVTPTQDELDAGLLRVRVLVRPNKAVRFIEVALEFPLPTA
jgi:phage tail sheath protein FI